MLTRTRDSRDAPDFAKGICHNRGFTIIDLLAAIAVVAIITTLALPSYRSILGKRQVTSGAEQLGAFLSAIQLESVERNERMAVSYSRSASDSWCIGFTVGTEACDCTITDLTDSNVCAVDGELHVFTDTELIHSDIMSTMTGDGVFVYDPWRGLMLNPADKVTLELVSPVEQEYGLSVEVTATGRVKICSRSDFKNVPGYQTCS